MLEDIKKSQRDEPESGIMTAINHAFGREGLIALWAGEGHLSTPGFIIDEMNASLARGETFYTWQRGIPRLREGLATYHERVFAKPFSMENFFVTCGGMQAIQTAIQMLVGKGDEVIVPTPAWPNYAGPLRMMDVNPVSVPLRFENRKWTLDLDQLFDAVTPKTRVICINSPSNPLGWVASLDELRAILDFTRKRGIWIVADEVYSRFYYGNETGSDRAPSFLDIYDDSDRLIFANTFSKNWAMTGWRIGWLQAPAELGETIEKIIQYNTSGVAEFMQHGCVAALEQGDDFIHAQVTEARTNRDMVTEMFSGFPQVQLDTPMGAFYHFFGIEGMKDSTATCLRIIDEANVGLAPGAGFGPGGEGFLRMCFLRDTNQLRTAMERLCNWLDKSNPE